MPVGKRYPRRYRTSLRDSVLSVVVLSMVPFLISQLLTLDEWRRTQQQVVLQNQLQAAQDGGTDLEAYLLGLQQGARYLRLQQHGRRVTALQPELIRLERVHAPVVLAVALTDRWGRITQSTRSGALGRSVSNTPFFAQLRAGSDHDLGDLDYLGNGEPFVVFSYAVRDKRRDLVAALLIALSPLHLSSVCNVQRTEGEEFFLADRTGALVYHTGIATPSRSLRATWRRHPLVVAALRDSTAYSADLHASMEPQAAMGAAARLQSMGWVAAGVCTRAKAEAPIELHARRSYLYLLGFALVTLAVAYLLASGLVRPLRQLSEAATRLGAGDLSARAGPGPQDEVGDLIVAFNNMAERTELDQERLREAYHREHYTSSLLQQALVPPAPRLGGPLELAVAFRPGGDGLLVGGDFYDAFSTGSGRVAVVLGDVCGKGVEAVAMAAATRGILRAFGFAAPSAADALRQANEVLCAGSGGEMGFVTVFLALLDPTTGAIDYCNAGHPPALLLSPSGEVESLAGPNLPLGVMRGFAFEGRSACLAEGARLLAFTDGLEEARGEAECLGTERLLQMAVAARDQSPSGLIRTLISAAVEWAQGDPEDDLTLLVVERSGPPPG